MIQRLVRNRKMPNKDEFNLSEKELTINNVDWQQVTEFYPREDVKEFIKKLKEETKDYVDKYTMEIIIDKLAGENLI